MLDFINSMLDFITYWGFLPGLIVLGIATSYTDIKSGLILNKHLTYGIIYGIFINIIIMLFTNINFAGYKDYLFNFIFSIIIGFIFWKIGLWTAGDGKLYAVMNMLSPPNIIESGYLGTMYGITFLTNTFIILTVIFIVKTIKKISKNEFFEALKATTNKEILITIPIFIFGMHFFTFLIPSFIPQNIITASIIMFILLSALRFLFKNQFKNFLIVLSILRLAFDFNSLFDINYWINFILIVVNIIIFMFLLVNLSFFGLTKNIKLDDLKLKMHLAEDIISVNFIELNEERNKLNNSDGKDIKYSKIKYINYHLIQFFMNKKFSMPYYDKNKGIRTRNLAWIKSNRHMFIFDDIRIFDTMPFAPFIFLGFLITTIIKSDIVFFVLNLLA